MELFEFLADKDLVSDEEAQRIDQSWEYARYMVDGGTEIEVGEVTQVIHDYKLLFAVLEDMHRNYEDLEDDYERLKDAVSRSIGGSK